jgi:hypothetical protein
MADGHGFHSHLRRTGGLSTKDDAISSAMSRDVSFLKHFLRPTCHSCAVSRASIDETRGFVLVGVADERKESILRFCVARAMPAHVFIGFHWIGSINHQRA